MQRRDFLTASAATLLAAGALPAARAAAPQDTPAPARLKGRVRHSVARWCFGGIPLDELCRQAKAMGIASVEILNEPEWKVVQSHGLTCALAFGPGSIDRGWNRAEHHDELLARAEALLPRVAADGLPGVVIFSGNRAGQPVAEGRRQCIAGLRRMLPLAEKLGVNVVMEILNSKVDHHDYDFDHMAYGLDLVQGVGSDRFRILYDIYHAQIMEGDVIRTIRDHAASIGHYHTAGVPGRHEIDDGQELNYGAICRAIVETGFTGFVAQEFIPAREPIQSLREAVAICDV